MPVLTHRRRVESVFAHRAFTEFLNNDSILRPLPYGSVMVRDDFTAKLVSIQVSCSEEDMPGDFSFGVAIECLPKLSLSKFEGRLEVVFSQELNYILDLVGGHIVDAAAIDQGVEDLVQYFLCFEILVAKLDGL